jgi:hypothetical protein
MIVIFYLEIEDGVRHTIVNYTVTKVEEIEWLLKQVKEKLVEAIALPSIPTGFGVVKEKEELGKKINKRF